MPLKPYFVTVKRFSKFAPKYLGHTPHTTQSDSFIPIQVTWHQKRKSEYWYKKTCDYFQWHYTFLIRCPELCFEFEFEFKFDLEPVLGNNFFNFQFLKMCATGVHCATPIMCAICMCCKFIQMSSMLVWHLARKTIN